MNRLSNLKKQVWDLCSKYYRLKYPVCQVCHWVKSTDVHHIIPRRKSNFLYFNELNLIVVCRTCHNKIHPVSKTRPCFDAVELVDIYERVIGKEGLEYLNKHRHDIKHDCQYELENLKKYFKEKLKELKDENY